MKKTLAILGLSAFLLSHPGYAEESAPAQPAKHHFRKVDGNKDGYVSRDEFIKRAERRFDKTDSNRDGKLSRDESRAAFEQMKARRAEWRAKRKARQGGNETVQ